MICNLIPLSIVLLILGYSRWINNSSIWIPLELTLGGVPLALLLIDILIEINANTDPIDFILNIITIIITVAAIIIHLLRYIYGIQLEKKGIVGKITRKKRIPGRIVDIIEYEYGADLIGKILFSEKAYLAENVLFLLDRPRINRVLIK